MKEMTCIVCPRGCRLKVDDEMNVTGNFCPRGKNYAISELTHPVRMVTSTVRVSNRDNMVASVKTSEAIDKDKVFMVIEAINKMSVSAPCHVGDILIKNIFDTNVDIVITKNIE
ncbi:MAG: DUF1667 domain-containing protein [Bacilli bacterium]|nr:DUF1667 domain-containing protein [Bacilli bacterium]